MTTTCPKCGAEIETPAAIQSAGGKARAAKLTPAQRSEIARKASRSRWAKRESKG